LQKNLKIGLEESQKILAKSVNLARQAIEEFRRESSCCKTKPIYVAGSIGSYGVILHDRSEYTGSFLKTTSEDVSFCC